MLHHCHVSIRRDAQVRFYFGLLLVAGRRLLDAQD
jgi:hypothetical protein